MEKLEYEILTLEFSISKKYEPSEDVLEVVVEVSALLLSIVDWVGSGRKLQFFTSKVTKIRVESLNIDIPLSRN